MGFSLLSAGNILIAIITYIRFAEIVQIFGTTWQTDAASIAMVIPLLLQQLISTAFGSVFIPVYSRVLVAGGKEKANRLISRIIYWMIILGSVMTGLVYVSGSTLISLIGPGVQLATSVLAMKMLWIFLPLVFLNAIEGVLQNFLNYGKRYGLVSFVRVLQIFVSFLVVLWGHKTFGIFIIPVSGLAGAIVSFFVTAGIAFNHNLRLCPAFDPRDKDFKELVRLAVPIIIGTLTGFLGPVADKALASFLQASSVTAIDYATRIKNLVRMLLIQPVIILSIVSFSRIAAESNITKLKENISSFIMNISYYAVPTAGIFVLLSVPIVSVLFQRGSFGPEQSRQIGYALAFYSPWFAQFGIGRIIDRAFYSLKDTTTPVVLGIWAMLANILLNVILLQPLGIGGLALATTLTSTTKTFLLVYFLRKRLGGVNGSIFIPEYLKILLATILMLGSLFLSRSLFHFDLNAPLTDKLVSLLLQILPAVVVYIVATALLKSKIYTNSRNMIKRYFDSKRRNL